MRLLWIAILTVLGCSTAPKKEHRAPPPPSPPSQRCEEFIETIKTCAQKSNHKDLEEMLERIARCETGNKCIGKIDSPSGEYHGAFQFLRATWNSQCHPVFARLGLHQCQKARAIYDVCCATICAADMIAAGGAHNWPTCSIVLQE